MKPLHQMSPEEKADIARKFDNLHKRPTTDDWAFWDALGVIDSLVSDGERNTRLPISDDTVSQHVVSHKGKNCIYKSITCQEGLCINCQVYLNQYSVS